MSVEIKDNDNLCWCRNHLRTYWFRALKGSGEVLIGARQHRLYFLIAWWNVNKPETTSRGWENFVKCYTRRSNSSHRRGWNVCSMCPWTQLFISLRETFFSVLQLVVDDDIRVFRVLDYPTHTHTYARRKNMIRSFLPSTLRSCAVAVVSCDLSHLNVRERQNQYSLF